MTAAPLAALARSARQYGPGRARRKLALLATLDRSVLGNARQVLQLHELLCWLAACPDDRRVHARARRMLRGFAARADLQRQRARLAGSGIAGTDTPYRFFWPTAEWLRRNWPGHLELERDDAEAERRLGAALPLLLGPAQAEWLGDSGLAPFAALDTLRPPGITDADFLLGLIDRLPGDDRSREHFSDALDLDYRLRAGRGTPERSTAAFECGSVHFQTAPPDRQRPDLRFEARRDPAGIRPVRGAAARRLIDLARTCMVTRARDLAAFQFASPADVLMVDDGDGLAFALLGTQPARRSPLASIYGVLPLRNGIPLGYVQLDVLGRHAALSFNTFPTFRGADTARLFARTLALARALFGCTEFSIEPYQLGVGNDEGIESGAWWFYYRLGFRPRAPAARRLAARELARRAASAGYRSSPATLRALARWHLFYSLEPGRQARLPASRRCLAAATAALRRLPGADPRQQATMAVSAVCRRVGPRRRPRLSRDQQQALANLAPIVLGLPDLRRWSAAERRALWQLVLAKGGRSERDYQRLLLAHARLRRWLDC